MCCLLRFSLAPHLAKQCPTYSTSRRQVPILNPCIGFLLHSASSPFLVDSLVAQVRSYAQAPSRVDPPHPTSAPHHTSPPHIHILVHLRETWGYCANVLRNSPKNEGVKPTHLSPSATKRKWQKPLSFCANQSPKTSYVAPWGPGAVLMGTRGMEVGGQPVQRQ